jgi:hypothetical protein
MTVPTIQNSSREIAVYKSVNHQLHEVERWIESVPRLADIARTAVSAQQRWDDKIGTYVWDIAEATRGRIAEIEALTATAGYKLTIATLALLTPPPPVDWVSDEILTLIASKPFGHTLDDQYPKILIELIGDMDPAPSTAAVMFALHELKLTPGLNPPDVGTVIRCIEAAEERFQYKYRPLLRLEAYGRRLAEELPKKLEEQRAGAEEAKRADERRKQYESERKREEEEKRKREEENWRKNQEFLAQWSAESGRKRWMFKQWETLFGSALRDAQQACIDDPSEENWAWVRALEDEMRERGFYASRTPSVE